MYLTIQYLILPHMSSKKTEYCHISLPTQYWILPCVFPYTMFDIAIYLTHTILTYCRIYLSKQYILPNNSPYTIFIIATYLHTEYWILPNNSLHTIFNIAGSLSLYNIYYCHISLSIQYIILPHITPHTILNIAI